MSDGKIQSIIFKKDKITIPEIIYWLEKHGYDYKKLHETRHNIRVRLHNPSKNKRFRIKPISDIISFVMEYPNEGGLLFGYE